MRMLITTLFLVINITTSCQQIDFTNEENTLINNNDTTLNNKFPTTEYGDTIYHRNGYSFSYNEKYEQPNWVQYTITPNDLNCEVKAKRKNNFKEDKSVITESASPQDYVGSGYDRGHLKPSADESCDQVQMDETFLMSNMSPQLPQFNRGMWKTLEAHVRDLALFNDSVKIITGGDLNEPLKVIGDNKVGVPNYYFKIIYVFNKNSSDTIGYYLPNKKISDNIENYILDINIIEDKVGIKFN